MAINAPNGAYSSLLGTATASLMPNSSTPTASTMISMTTQQSNSSILTAHSASTTTGSQTCWTVRTYVLCIVSKATVMNGHTTTEVVTTTLNSTLSQAATTSSQTTKVEAQGPILHSGRNTTEMISTTLRPISSHQSSTPSPVITPPAKPTGPMYGVYIALWSNTEVIPQPNGLPPQFNYESNDLIWVSAVPATASDDLLTGPQYCETEGVDRSISITENPAVDQTVPYPTALITSLQPSGTSGPSCDWIPSLNNDEPGSLLCDVAPVTVDCVVPAQAATTCGSENTEVEPMVQCIWQGK